MCCLADCLSSTQLWPVPSGQLFWLVDLLLDVYLFCLVFGNLHEGVSRVSSSLMITGTPNFWKTSQVVYALVAYIHTMYTFKIHAYFHNVPVFRGEYILSGQVITIK